MPDNNWNRQAESLCANPAIVRVTRWLAENFLKKQSMAPRAVSVFATQHKWLMGHVAASLYLRGDNGLQTGLTKQDFVRAVVDHGIASRNTAVSFLMEMIKYGFAAPATANAANGSVRYNDVIRLTETTLNGVRDWHLLHLGGLDMLDGGDRVARFTSDLHRALAMMEPLLCDWILACPETRNPRRVYSVFTWADEGGLLLDRLIAGADADTPLDEGRALTSVLSTTGLAGGLGLSRTHTARLLAEAEALGALGWTGPRGRSQLWISREFRHDYTHFQALKLAMLDSAFSTAFPERGHSSAECTAQPRP